MADTPKRFEDWEEVDCNECERWWLSQCDGASKGAKVGCNSYLATRKVVIPEKITRLEKRISDLEWSLVIEGIAFCLALTLLCIFGG